MRIVFIAWQDFNNCGDAICRAINAHTPHRATIICEASHPFDFPQKNRIGRELPALLQSILNAADVFVWCDDLPRRQLPGGLVAPPRPDVQIVCGNRFRNAAPAEVAARRQASAARVALTADLNRPEFDAVYIPQCLPGERDAPAWRPRRPPRLVHAPSHNRGCKGTDGVLLPALEAIRGRGLPFDFDLIENVPNADCLKRKRRAQLLFDQADAGIGYYGTNATEAIARGIPAVAYVSAAARAQAGEHFDDCPLPLLAEPTAAACADLLGDLLGRDLEDLAARVFAWGKRRHGAAVVAQAWAELLESIA